MFNENEIKNLDLDSRLEKILIVFGNIFKYVSFFAFLFIMYLPFIPRNFKEENKNNFKEREFLGVVIKSYIDYKNHASHTIVFSNYNKEVISSKLFSNINNGDSIVKIKGELTAKIYKVDGRLVIYNYLKDN